MLDREVVKEFLIGQFEEFSPIPNEIDLGKLVEDFCSYTENDYYGWLKDNFKSYFLQLEYFDWEVVKNRLINSPTYPT